MEDFKMFKKLAIMGAVAVLAAIGTAYSTAAQAITPGWYVVSICSGDARVCPLGPNPFYIGPYTSHAQCLQAWTLWAQGPANLPPRYLISDCIQY
jgi:hypothetical protein